MRRKNGPKSEAYFMRRALRWAERAAAEGEVPVGCVVVKDGRILAGGYNRREQKQDPTEHAEMMALRRAARRLGSWRLEGCTLYVSLEPCFMCVAAIQQARLARIVYAAADPKAGAVESQGRHFTEHPLNHVCAVEAGLLAEQSEALLKRFFKDLRRAKKCGAAGGGG